jgi:4-hydroxy-4-methyl-2-oxoglutarate aldolase
MRDELRFRALELGASTMYEAGGGVGAMDPAIRPVWRGAAMCGLAFPVRCHVGDNLPIHRALERCEPGDVLVVDAMGDDSGYFGEVLATAAEARGIAGVVVDGGVRDVLSCERRAFPVFARWISMRRTVKHEPGLIGEPVNVGGVTVSRESIVVADSDGVLVTPLASFEDVLHAAETRAKREAEIMGRLRLGELTLDLLGIRKPDA